MDTTWQDLDVDSLDLVEVVRILEDHYGIQIVDEKLEGVASVGDAVRLIQSIAAEQEGRLGVRSHDVVITGRGAVTSIGEGADAFLDGLYERRSGIADGLGACAEFDPEAAMTPKEARRADRYTQLGVAAAEQAAAEAGLPEGVEPERLGVLMGPAVGGLETSSASARTGSRAATAPSRRSS